MMEERGLVFNIQRFCVHDGPGIRTAIFLKGCPLSCIWCHNPESKQLRPQLSYNDRLCTGCRECEKVCEHRVHDFSGRMHHIHYDNCIACGKCEQACPASAMELIGRSMFVEEIMEIAKRDSDYYQSSGGGITLSGGEPLFQPEFSLSLLKSGKRSNFHTCVETSGFCSSQIMEQIIPYTDLFLFDYKVGNSEQHKKYTSVSNTPIISNLQLLNQCRANVILRCPIIPGINDNEEHFRSIIECSRLACIQSVEIMAYHTLGMEKAKKIGSEYLLEIPSAPDSLILAWQQKLCNMGCGKLVSH